MEVKHQLEAQTTLFPGEITGYELDRMLDGLKSCSGHFWTRDKSINLTDFEIQNVQPVA
jgi:hypothetical protein